MFNYNYESTRLISPEIRKEYGYRNFTIRDYRRISKNHIDSYLIYIVDNQSCNLKPLQVQQLFPKGACSN